MRTRTYGELRLEGPIDDARESARKPTPKRDTDTRQQPDRRRTLSPTRTTPLLMLPPSLVPATGTGPGLCVGRRTASDQAEGSTCASGLEPRQKITSARPSGCPVWSPGISSRICDPSALTQGSAQEAARSPPGGRVARRQLVHLRRPPTQLDRRTRGQQVEWNSPARALSSARSL